MQESGEMYLETIFLLKQKKNSVRSIDIVEEMNYSKSSVSRAVNLLQKKGFININADGLIDFTDKGLSKARDTYERHEILTEYFVSLGVKEDIAEADACKIEHVISNESFEAIKNNLKK